MHDAAVRRRHGSSAQTDELDDGVTGDEWDAQSRFLGGPSGGAGGRGRAAASHDGHTSASEAAAIAGAFFSTLGKAIGDGRTALVAKLKKVSSQPSIGGGGADRMGSGTSTSISQAADGVLSSIRHGMLPKGSLVSSGPSSAGRPPRPNSASPSIVDAPPFYSRTAVASTATATMRGKGGGKSD